MSDDPVQALLDKLFEMPQVKETIEQVQDVLDRVGAAIEPRPAPAPARPRLTQEQVARRVMNFGDDEALDPKKIAQRRRELARHCHPDHGGSTDAMQRLNRAAEILTRLAR